MRLVFLLCLSLLLLGCRVEWGPPGGAIVCEDEEPQGDLWIYTSMYQSVIDAIQPQLQERFPELRVHWNQSGSERISQRYEAELQAGGSRACMLLTSDPFWYADLADRDLLLPYVPPNALSIDRSLVDPQGRWVTARISLMVLAANEERLAEGERPSRLTDLADERWRDRFSMGDPLASGTSYATLAFLDHEEGWGFVQALRRNGMVASGGNSSVLTRIETGEREVGVVLLENVLAASRRRSPAVPIYPEDGAIAVPGPVAITRGCPNPGAAKAVYDFLLSDAGQQAMVAGDMYAALPHLPPPQGARPLEEVEVRAWTPEFLQRAVRDKNALKDRYAELVAERGP